MDRGPEAGSGIRNYAFWAAPKERLAIELVVRSILLTVLVAVVTVTFFAAEALGLDGKARALMFGILAYVVVPVGITTLLVLRYLRRLKTGNDATKGMK